MKYLSTKIVIAALLIQYSFNVSAQVNSQINYPEIGKPCPDFSLSKIFYYTRENASLKDFKGKWLVLDFFSAGCYACFRSFKETDEMRKEFNGKIEFILIGYDDAYVRPSFEKFRKKQNFNLPVAYDTSLFTQFGIRGVPAIFVIDEIGNVRAITIKITKKELDSLINGEDPQLFQKLNAKELGDLNKKYDGKRPLLINGNGGNDTAFLFRSILTSSDGFYAPQQDFISVQYFGNRVQLIGKGLSDLYDCAYGDTIFRGPDYRGSSYGEYWRQPLLEIKDQRPFHLDIRSGKNKYNYSLIIPTQKASSRYLQQIMQKDLKSYFGYNVTIETRMMPCWKLVATKEARVKLKTKRASKKEKQFAPFTGFSFVDVPVKELIAQLWLWNQNEPPIIDATGIKGNIDIEIDALLTDFTDMKRALNDNGLNLVKGEKNMKVIVIRD